MQRILNLSSLGRRYSSNLLSNRLCSFSVDLLVYLSDTAYIGWILRKNTLILKQYNLLFLLVLNLHWIPWLLPTEDLSWTVVSCVAPFVSVVTVLAKSINASSEILAIFSSFCNMTGSLLGFINLTGTCFSRFYHCMCYHHWNAIGARFQQPQVSFHSRLLGSRHHLYFTACWNLYRLHKDSISALDPWCGGQGLLLQLYCRITQLEREDILSDSNVTAVCFYEVHCQTSVSCQWVRPPPPELEILHYQKKELNSP